MTIVSEGNIENAPEYTRKCPECGAIIKYHYNETEDVGWRGGYRAIKCPTCGYMILHCAVDGDSTINHPLISDAN